MGVKAKDYQDFKRTAELIKNKALASRLTQSGLDEILIIKRGGGMNIVAEDLLNV